METIGKYQVKEKIGSGGFGEVFRGYDPFIKRHVAIKTCVSEDEEVTSRFFQEAEIAGNLHHRNITTVYDFGIHEGLPYLIQEYLSGEDLDTKIKRRDYLPYPEKLFYLLQVARGLAHAHSKGVIHRDIKPANVRILEDGTAKIMDFGIAKLAQQESGLTKTGMTLGTAAYLAPEQVRGDAVDLRTDIFSFGVLGYELLTYQRPFQGDQISTVLYNLLHREPEPLTAHWPGAPPELVALIDRCLRKDMVQRFADGRDLVKELETLQKRGGRRQAQESPAVQGPESRSTRPIPASAVPDRPTGHGVEEIEYRQGPDRPPAAAPAADVAGEGPARSRRSSFGWSGMLLLLAVAAAAGGWWLGTRVQPAGGSQDVAHSPVEEARLSGAAAESVPADPAPPPPSASEEPAPSPTSEPAPGQPGAAPPPTAEPRPEAAAETPDDAGAEEPPPPPPPPEPTTGQLILPPVGWTDRMTVRIGAESYRLRRRRTIELPPGRHEAVFALDTAAYKPRTRTVEVQIVAGKNRTIPIPIPQPGALSIRPLPGRSQAQVSLDGEVLGPTPLSGIRREPGSYTLEIRPRSGDGEGLTREIILEAGREVILSFDLDAGDVKTRSKPLVL